ncbi:hypothetical protein HAX54_020609, partial [Datura stramonium]|nr:hypothetical protein [Datura stramonium]
KCYQSIEGYSMSCSILKDTNGVGKIIGFFYASKIILIHLWRCPLMDGMAFPLNILLTGHCSCLLRRKCYQ